MSQLPDWVKLAQEQWNWRGTTRPPFAVVPNASQISVWDFPRPPKYVEDRREVVICFKGQEIARTKNAILVLETAHPPSFYIPPKDINFNFLKPSTGNSFCEWKGPAQYWDIDDGINQLKKVAWSYAQPFDEAKMIADHIAFYPTHLQCTVDGQPVLPQPSGFYGGWITPELVGPFKGEPGSESW